jgi:hypothetical protein
MEDIIKFYNLFNINIMFNEMTVVSKPGMAKGKRAMAASALKGAVKKGSKKESKPVLKKKAAGFLRKSCSK